MAANITARVTPEMGPGENSLPSQQEIQVTVTESANRSQRVNTTTLSMWKCDHKCND
jgi:hypothetical protein